MKFQWLTLITTLLLASQSGCTIIYAQWEDMRDDRMIKNHNQKLAKDAWLAVEGVYQDVPCITDFAEGFRCGYSEVARGTKGCPPALPPRKYWQAKYRGVVGKDRTQAWFDGFRHGTILAEQDGVFNLSRIPTSVPTAAPLEEFAGYHTGGPAGGAAADGPISQVPGVTVPEALPPAAPAPAPTEVIEQNVIPEKPAAEFEE